MYLIFGESQYNNITLEYLKLTGANAKENKNMVITYIHGDSCSPEIQ
jgi:aminoglycoside phosphotransferase